MATGDKITLANNSLSNITDLGKILELDGSGSGLDADTVDGYHVYATPTANSLIPLDGTGKFPEEVIPSTGGGDADTVDGFHASSTPTANTLLAMDSNGKIPSSALNVLGVGQTWQSVSRSLGVTYTNSTGKPIAVIVSLYLDDSTNRTYLNVYVNDVQIGKGESDYYVCVSFIVPNGATYKVTGVSGNSIVYWYELR